MKIVRYDLAGLEADALVNSACGEVRVGAGVDSAVYAKGVYVVRQAVSERISDFGGGSGKWP